MNSSLDSYLDNGQMARNKVRIKGAQILSAASLLSTDIFVYTQFGDTFKYPSNNNNNNNNNNNHWLGERLLTS